MRLNVAFILECGHKIVTEKDVWWNTTDGPANQIEISRFDSWIAFNRIGNMLYCDKHNDNRRIRDVHMHVLEFDARREIV
jgi:hypothetical protein